MRLCRFSAYSRTPVVAARRGSGRLIRKFPVMGFRLQSGVFRSYSPDALSHSALCPKLLQPYAACRPAKPSACPLKTGTTPPGGKAAVSLRLRRADRTERRRWTCEYTDIDTLSYPYGHGYLTEYTYNIPTRTLSFPIWTYRIIDIDRTPRRHGQVLSTDTPPDYGLFSISFLHKGRDSVLIQQGTLRYFSKKNPERPSGVRFFSEKFLAASSPNLKG